MIINHVHKIIQALRRLTTTILLLFLFIFSSALSTQAYNYGEPTRGLGISAGKFSLFITHDVYLEKYDEGLNYLHDPSDLLFDLIALLQKHYEEISVVNMQYWIEIDIRESKIIVTHMNPKTGEFIPVGRNRIKN